MPLHQHECIYAQIPHKGHIQKIPVLRKIISALKKWPTLYCKISFAPGQGSLVGYITLLNQLFGGHGDGSERKVVI